MIFNGKEYKYIDASELERYTVLGWIKKGVPHSKHKGKKLECPKEHICFDSQKDAANYYNVSNSTISIWVKKGILLRT